MFPRNGVAAPMLLPRAPTGSGGSLPGRSPHQEGFGLEIEEEAGLHQDIVLLDSAESRLRENCPSSKSKLTTTGLTYGMFQSPRAANGAAPQKETDRQRPVPLKCPANKWSLVHAG